MAWWAFWEPKVYQPPAAGRWQPTSANRHANARRLEIRARRRVTSDFAGQYQSAFKGQGLTWSDLREYAPGDDIRAIHWKASARSGRVFVKSYHEERHRRVLFALDTSASMQTGAPLAKVDSAREFIALVSELGAKNGDALGLCLFGAAVTTLWRPRAKRRTKEEIIRRIGDSWPLSSASNLAGALDAIATTIQEPTLLFVVSDFLTPLDAGLQDSVRRLAIKHDLVAVHIHDSAPLAATLRGVGLVALRDSETGEFITRDLSAAHADAWSVAVAGRAKEVEALFTGVGASYLPVRGAALPALAAFCRARRGRG